MDTNDEDRVLLLRDQTIASAAVYQGSPSAPALAEYLTAACAAVAATPPEHDAWTDVAALFGDVLSDDLERAPLADRVGPLDLLRALPRTVPLHAGLCLVTAEALLNRGTAFADVLALRQAEALVRLRLDPGIADERMQVQFLELLRALRCTRVVLADPEVEDKGPSAARMEYELLAKVAPGPGNEGDLAAQRLLVAVEPRGVHAALANIEPPAGQIRLADAALAVANLHWERFCAERGGCDEPELTAGVSMVLVPHDGTERTDVLLRIGVGEVPLNAAFSMYALAAVERPEAAPDSLRALIDHWLQVANRLAYLAFQRAGQLLDEHDRTGNPEPLHLAVDKLVRGISGRYVAPFLRDLLSGLLGDALVRLHLVDHDEQPLARAVGVLRRVAHNGREFRTRARGNLGDALLREHALTGTIDALDDAIKVMQGLLESTPDEVTAAQRASLGSALIERFRAARASYDLEVGTVQLRDALGRADLPEWLRPQAVRALALALVEYGDLEHWQESVLLLTDLVRSTPPEAADRIQSIAALARVAVTEAEEEQPFRHAAAAVGEPRSQALRDYCEALAVAHPRGGANERTIELCRACIGAAPTHGVEQRKLHRTLAFVLRDAYAMQGRLSDLREAEEHDRLALELTSPDDPDYPLALALWAESIHLRFEHCSEAGLLEVAFEASAKAFRAWRANDASHLVVLTIHASVATTFAEYLGPFEALIGLVPTLRQARRATSARPCPGGDQEPDLAAALAMVLHHLWLRGVDVDLDEALVAARHAAAGSGSPSNQARRLSNLGYLLLDAHRARGDDILLEESIASSRSALRLEETAGVSRGIALLNLASALMRRRHAGDSAALIEAIGLLRVAARDSAGRSEEPIVLSGLGGALLALQKKEGNDPEVLEEALECLRRSVALTPRGHHQAERHLINLSQGIALLADDATLRQDEALAVAESALKLTPEGHPSRSTVLLASAKLHRQRFLRTQDPTEREHAIALLSEVDGSTAFGPNIVDAAMHLAQWFAELAQEHGDPEFRHRAVMLLRDGSAVAAAPARKRAESARAWADQALALGDLPSAVSAFEIAVDLAVRAASPELEARDQERSLGDYRGVARRGAACAVELGDLERAVMLLERGRAVGLGRGMAERRQLRELRRLAPDIADDLARIRARLATSAVGRGRGADPFGENAHRIERSHLEHEYEILVDRIRALGFGELFATPGMRTLQAAAANGPVVLVNVSWRCDAIIVTSHGVQLVPLPALDEKNLVRGAELFTAATHVLMSGENIDLGIVFSARSIVVQTLRWLWDIVAAPVLDALGLGAPVADPPRLWWCPTGPLCFLPLHAAGGRHSDGADVWVSDCVCSSYTPTLRSLREAAAADDLDPERPLIVAASGGPGAISDATLADERSIATFTARFPGAQVLRGPAATADAVLAAVRDATIVHFTTHAHQDSGDPSSGALHLWDRTATVSELRQCVTEGGTLAMVLGCETARGGTRLVDEVVSLATALQHAGYRHTVGALWPIDDDDSERVAESVYAYAASDLRPGTIARAVAAAVAELRERYPAAPHRWCAFVHIGP